MLRALRCPRRLRMGVVSVLLPHHHFMNMHGSQVFFSFSPPCFFRLTHTDVAAEEAPLEPPRLHYISTVGPEPLLPCCILTVAFSAHGGLFVFARSCHIQPVSTSPWEIYTEPLVWGEAIKRAGDMLPDALVFGEMYVFVCRWMYAASQKWVGSVYG